ncbi:hypothetical protein ACH4U3_24235 [Streptomyces griseoruber]|uniref:hypothetical protein n=1 Tax=Streptomyces griseoruber TaxID=1943 RepID=UPI0037AC8873
MLGSYVECLFEWCFQRQQVRYDEMFLALKSKSRFSEIATCAAAVDDTHYATHLPDHLSASCTTTDMDLLVERSS